MRTGTLPITAALLVNLLDAMDFKLRELPEKGRQTPKDWKERVKAWKETRVRKQPHRLVSGGA